MSNRAPTSSTRVRAQVDMHGSVTLYLPPPKDASENQDRVICRDVLGMLAHAGIGWASQAQAQFLGDAFIEALGALLWLINDHWDKLKSRCCEPSDFWIAFKDRRRKHNKSSVDIEADSDNATVWLNKLEGCVTALLTISALVGWHGAPSWHAMWEPFLKEVTCLVETMDKYLVDREKKRVGMRIMRSKPAPDYAQYWISQLETHTIVSYKQCMRRFAQE